ncbi:MAG TPA: MdtA/MuxA family multidrug efflux RND transporter periplasmic adaptor subunit [Planctomycetota bacterium]|nr:MdtA/MuxA family multidrug efflux RND transporter periplasmic adaptor subunit [Planctomycetota bacterium]
MRRNSGSVWLWLVLAAGLIAAGFWLAPRFASEIDKKRPSEEAGPRATPVVVAKARTGDMKLYLTGLGTVTALNTVTIRSRVDGQLDLVAYTEGQMVKEGDLLAQIDPRPFQAQLDQAEGQLARDQSLLKNARIDLERDQIAKDAISAQQLATQAALVAQYEGVVRSDQAQADMARLQLIYCRITSPLTGRIGLRLVDQGNMVHASDAGGLAVVTQLQPISVVFSLPSVHIPAILRKKAAGQPLTVEAYDQELKNQLTSGTLLAIDNQIDPGTGTVKIKANFLNSDSQLFPNQFVNARLLIDDRKGVVLIPTAAIQRGIQSSNYVYVVKETPSKKDPSKMEQTVALQNIDTGPTEGEDTIIESGLKDGDIVVTDGVDKLQPGARVSIPEGRKPPVKVKS